MDYANLRMKDIPYVILNEKEGVEKMSTAYDWMWNSYLTDTGVYLCGRAGINGPIAGYSKENPCHAKMNEIFRSETGVFTIWNKWDSLNKLKDKDAELGEKMFFEFFFGKDSPWKAVFPFIRILRVGGRLWVEFNGDDEGKWTPGYKSIVMNLCIALRTPFEGNYGSSHVSINYGVTNIVRLMATYKASYREAMYLNRIFDWGIENKAALRLHTPKAVDNGGFVHHFLYKYPTGWLNGFSPSLSTIKSYSMIGNDAKLWGGPNHGAIRPMKNADRRPLINGAFARYDLPHLLDFKTETVEDYLKYILEEIRGKTSKAKKKAA